LQRLEQWPQVQVTDAPHAAIEVSGQSAPNCVAYEEHGAGGRTIIAFYALRAIQAGEELFLDYSLEVDDAREPQAFACACRGTMLASA